MLKLERWSTAEEIENKYFECHILIKSDDAIKGEISTGEGGKGAFFQAEEWVTAKTGGCVLAGSFRDLLAVPQGWLSQCMRAGIGMEIKLEK